jgi:hypothetical protein
VANHEKTFDRLSKRFAVAVSRRSILHSLSAAVASTFLPWTKAFGQEPPKRAIGEWPKSLVAFMESPDFKTVVIEKRLLKPGSSLSDPTQMKRVRPVCTYLVEISMARGVTGGPASFTQKFSCPAPNGICLPVMACQKEATRISREGGETTGVRRDVSKNSNSNKNGVQDNCKLIEDTAPNTVSALQFIDSGGALLEELCFVSYSCEKAGLGTAMCPPNQEVVVVGGKESVETTCPQVNDCIAAQVPRLPGYTQAELDAMPGDKRKETSRMLAEPAVPYKQPT